MSTMRWRFVGPRVLRRENVRVANCASTAPAARSAKSLFAVHQYLVREADHLAMRIVAVVGAAPDWDAPWSRATYLDVVHGINKYDLRLVDDNG